MQTYQELANSQWLAQADLQHLREAAALLNVVPAIPANADLAQTRTAISTFLNATPNAILPVIPWFDIQPQQQTRRRTQPTNRRRNTNRATSNNIWPWIFGAVVALAFIIAATIIGTRLICNNCGSAPVQTQVVPTQPIVNPTATTAIVSTPIPPTTIPTAACAYNGDPIAPNAYTPANVFVLDETVNYSLKTISSTFYFTSVPVQASIIGQVHHNLWIYCTLDAANKGAQTEFAERSSEALQPGWANGFTVYAPFGR